MQSDAKTPGATIPQESEQGKDMRVPDASEQPPKVYIAACGVLCDVFWWARRRPE
jgi:hypothetical protein